MSKASTARNLRLNPRPEGLEDDEIENVYRVEVDIQRNTTATGLPLGNWRSWVDGILRSHLSTSDAMKMMEVFNEIGGGVENYPELVRDLQSEIRSVRLCNKEDAEVNTDIYIPPIRSDIEKIQIAMRELSWRVRRNRSTGLTEVICPDVDPFDDGSDEWQQMTDDIEATIHADIEKHCVSGEVAQMKKVKGKWIIQWSLPEPMRVRKISLEQAIKVERRRNEIDPIFTDFLSPLMHSPLYEELRREIDATNGEIPGGWLLPDFLHEVADIPDTCNNVELARHFGVGVLGACVARQFRPGAEHDQMFLMIGKQGAFKSGLLRTLVPDYRHYTNQVRADLKTQELIHHTRGRILCEIPEMVGFTGRRMEEFTSFCSTHVDGARMVYEKYETLWPRRWVVVGTTNNFRILPYADTGNRRFIPIRVERHKTKGYDEVKRWVEEHRDRLWTEAIAWFKKCWVGPYSAHLPRHLESKQDFACKIHSDVGALENHAKQFLEVGIALLLEPGLSEPHDVILTHQEIFGFMDREEPTNSDRNRMGRILKSRGVEQTCVSRDGKTHKAFRFTARMIADAIAKREEQDSSLDF